MFIIEISVIQICKNICCCHSQIVENSIKSYFKKLNVCFKMLVDCIVIS